MTITVANSYTLDQVNVGDIISRKVKGIIQDSEVVKIIETKSGKTVSIIIKNDNNESGMSTFIKGLKTTDLFVNFK